MRVHTREKFIPHEAGCQIKAKRMCDNNLVDHLSVGVYSMHLQRFLRSALCLDAESCLDHPF